MYIHIYLCIYVCIYTHILYIYYILIIYIIYNVWCEIYIQMYIKQNILYISCIYLLIKISTFDFNLYKENVYLNVSTV